MWSFLARIKDPDGKIIGMSIKKKKKIFFEKDSYIPMPWLWRYIKPTIIIKSFRRSSVSCYSVQGGVLACYPISVRFKLFGVDISDIDSLGYLYTGTDAEPTIVLVRPLDYHTVHLAKSEFFKHAQCTERKKDV